MFGRWIARWREARLRKQLKRDRQQFDEAKDIAAYYEDQVANLNVEIDVRYTELQGLVLVRNTMAMKRDTWEATQTQLEAQYRSA